MKKKFYKRSIFWIWLVFFIITLALYIKGALIEREVGLRPNYPLAFAEILTVVIYGVGYKVIAAYLESKFFKLNSFLSSRPAIPYLCGFIGFLVVATFLSLSKYSFVAKQLANISYFLLVTAVAIEFINLVKNKS